MKDKDLFYKILNYKLTANKYLLEDLINDFIPLIKKYFNKLNSEDSTQDLILTFIESINKISLDKFDEDKYILPYINKAIKNKYHRLYNEKIKNDRVINDDSILIYKGKNDDELNVLIECLSYKEREIISLIYFKNISVVDIANKYKTSRQNINQIKLRSLKKLKKYIEN